MFLYKAIVNATSHLTNQFGQFLIINYLNATVLVAQKHGGDFRVQTKEMFAATNAVTVETLFSGPVAHAMFTARLMKTPGLVDSGRLRFIYSLT